MLVDVQKNGRPRSRSKPPKYSVHNLTTAVTVCVDTEVEDTVCVETEVADTYCVDTAGADTYCVTTRGADADTV